MSKNLLLKLNNALESGKLFEIVDNSLSSTQVLYKLGYSPKGQYIKFVSNYLSENEVDTSHFTVNGREVYKLDSKTCPCCFKSFNISASDKRKITCSKSCSNTYFRTQILGGYKYREKAIKYYGAVCMTCGYDNNILALEVHHIDKDRKNNSIENLKVLCANCHTIVHKNIPL